MNRLSDYALVILAALALGGFVNFILPNPNAASAPAQPAWDYDPARVRQAVTQQLTDALCPPYSQLHFTEDGTYRCLPG